MEDTAKYFGVAVLLAFGLMAIKFAWESHKAEAERKRLFKGSVLSDEQPSGVNAW